MRLTLQQQIGRNVRSSVLFGILIALLLAGLGTVIVGLWMPREWFFGTAGALALGVVFVLVARYKGDEIMLATSGAREATEAEDQVLRNVVEEMALAAGLPVPRIMVLDSDAPNAFATGSDPPHATIAVTRGLLDKLNRDELQGVVAHEMGHVRNYDIRFMTMIGILAGLIPLLADVFLQMTWFGGGRSNDRDSEDNTLGLIFLVVGLVLAILAPICALMLQMAVSRKREFLADATAAELTRYPAGLASALQKIATDPTPLKAANRATQPMYIVNPMNLNGGGSSLFSTHPDTEERIRALMALAGNYGPAESMPIA